MSRSDAGADLILVAVSVAICIGLGHCQSCNTCHEVDVGRVRVNNLDGHQVETCDGKQWVPAKVMVETKP